MLEWPHCYASEPDKINTNALQFVSLGSHCLPAHMFRNCEVRKAAFPFDWIASFNGQALINILETDFHDFLNEEYLIAYESGRVLLHTKYHLEFLHDGHWSGDQYLSSMLLLKAKYLRRINRFRQLNDYQGKVFFIRCAYLYSNSNPQRFYRNEENIEITEEYALKLYDALKKNFPNLNFSLIILNNGKGLDITEEKKITDHIYIFRFDPGLDFSRSIESYKIFFNKLQQYY